MNEHSIGQTTARVFVLPARVAYLIAPGSRAGFRRAVQEASCRWAGMTELIVPVPSRGRVAPAWKQMIEYGAYDCLVNVDVDQKTADHAASDLRLPLVALRHIDRSDPSRWSVHPANIETLSPRTSASVMATTDDADLWEVTAAGDLTAEHIADVGTQGFVRRPRTRDEIGRAQLSGVTLLSRGAEQFGEHHAVNGPFPTPTVLWITTPNSLKDCIWFWNCRALRPLTFEEVPMHLLPHRALDHWVDFGEQFRSTLARSEDIEPDVFICSLSVGDPQLRVIARLLGLKASTKKSHTRRKFPPPPARTPPFTYKLNVDPRDFVLFKRRYGRTADAIIQTGTKRTLLRVESPVRFSGSGQVLLRISSSAFDHLPRISTTAEMLLRNADWANGDLQVRTNASSRYHLELTIPAIDDATWAVLRQVTAHAELSDKGRLAHRLEALASPGVLLRPGVFDLVRELTTPRSKELRRELTRLRADGHADADLAELAAAWGGRTQRRHRALRDLRGVIGEHVHDAAEVLAAEGWAERGLEIRCDQCSIRSFVPMQEVEARPACPACEAAQKFDSAPDLRIYYRLNGLVDRASDQGVLPHLMAKAALLACDNPTYLLMGVDVQLKDGTAAEVDLFGVHGGKVVAGEAKTSSSEFSPEQLRRDIKLSQRLGADLHLLVSPNPISDQVVGRAQRLVQPTGMSLVTVLGGSVQVVGGAQGGGPGSS